MYLEKLFIDKNKLKTFERSLSKELFDNKMVKLKYDSKTDSFFINLEKDKIYVNDFFDLQNIQNDKIDFAFNIVEFVKVSNLIASKLFDKNNKTYIDSAINYYHNKTDEQKNYIFRNYDSTKHSYKTLKKYGLDFELDKLRFYSSVCYKLKSCDANMEIELVK